MTRHNVFPKIKRYIQDLQSPAIEHRHLCHRWQLADEVDAHSTQLPLLDASRSPSYFTLMVIYPRLASYLELTGCTVPLQIQHPMI